MKTTSEYFTYQKEYMRFHTQHSDIHKAFEMGRTWRADGNDEHFVQDGIRTGYAAMDNEFCTWASKNSRTLGTLNAMHDAWRAGWETENEKHSSPCIGCGNPVWDAEYYCSTCLPPWTA